MNAELERAEQALAEGNRESARVHAWNALARVEPKDGPALTALALELDDEPLLEELRRSMQLLRESEPEPKPARPRAEIRQELEFEREKKKVGPAPTTRFRFRTLIFPAVIVLIALAVAADSLGSEAGAPKPVVEPPGAAFSVPTAPPETSGVWIVQVGQSERVPLQQLAMDMTRRYGIPVGLLPGTPDLPSFVLDPRRHRLDGDALLGLLAAQYYVRKRATLIGVTDFSMFSDSLDSDRPFLLGDASHYAIVSTADLGGDAYSRLRGHTRYQRTRKLVARAIGLVHLHRAVSQDPHSLLRSSMSSVDDIDALHERPMSRDG